MIGDQYWTTGIVIANEAGRHGWDVHLEFFDGGFAQDGSTEGRLRVRYLMTDLAAAVDLLAADAERLGIAFGVGENGMTVWAKGDDERWQAAANEQAERRGWRIAYSGASISPGTR